MRFGRHSSKVGRPGYFLLQLDPNRITAESTDSSANDVDYFLDGLGSSKRFMRFGKRFMRFGKRNDDVADTSDSGAGAVVCMFDNGEIGMLGDDYRHNEKRFMRFGR